MSRAAQDDLMKAIAMNSPVAMKVALRNGGNLDTETFYKGQTHIPGKTLLARAFASGDASLMLEAELQGHSLRRTLERQITLDMLPGLCRAHAGGQVLGFILEHRPGPDWETWQDAQGNTLFHLMAGNERPLQLAALIKAAYKDKNNAWLAARNALGQTVLHLVRDHVSASLLVRCGARLEATDLKGHTALHGAVDRLAKSARRKRGILGVDTEEVRLVALMAYNTNTLLEDPHAHSLARRLGRLRDIGMETGNSEKLDQTFKQVDALLAEDRRRKLVRLAKGKRGRSGARVL